MKGTTTVKVENLICDDLELHLRDVTNVRIRLLTVYQVDWARVRTAFNAVQYCVGADGGHRRFEDKGRLGKEGVWEN